MNFTGLWLMCKRSCLRLLHHCCEGRSDFVLRFFQKAIDIVYGNEWLRNRPPTFLQGNMEDYFGALCANRLADGYIYFLHDYRSIFSEN